MAQIHQNGLIYTLNKDNISLDEKKCFWAKEASQATNEKTFLDSQLLQTLLCERLFGFQKAFRFGKNIHICIKIYSASTIVSRSTVLLHKVKGTAVCENYIQIWNLRILIIPIYIPHIFITGFLDGAGVLLIVPWNFLRHNSSHNNDV